MGRLHYFWGNLIIFGAGTFVMIIYPNEYLSFVFTVLTLPITVRRLHDINLSGYLAPIGWLSYFKGIFIIVAVFFNLFLLFKKGDKEANQYGDTPKPGRKFINAILNREFKIENTDKDKKIHVAFKIIGWVLVVLLFLIVVSIYGERTAKNIFRSTESKPTTLYSDQVTIPGFVKYTDTEKESGFKFSILFPTNSPETYDLNLESGYIKSYQAHHIFNQEEGKFASYNLHIAVPKVGKILSEESKRAYLMNYPESKVASVNGILTKKEMTTLKGLMAVEYKYEYTYEMYEIEMVRKGISFIVDGIPIDLSVGYTSSTSESSVYYNDYIKSFAISQD